MDAKNSNTRTKTTLFMVPLLGYLKRNVITENFVNAYSRDENEPGEEKYIYLKYIGENKNLDEKHCFIVYPVEKTPPGTPSESYWVYRYSIPKPLSKKFTEGKYSMFTPIEKQKILAFWGVSKGSRLHSILNPRDSLLEQFGSTYNLSPSAQIWPRPLTTEETFKR